MTIRTVLAVLIALVVGGVGGYFLNRPSESSKKTDDAITDRSPKITALGRIQPLGGVVPVHGPPGDRILKLYPNIQVGSALKKDEPIADLDSKRLRQQEVDVADQQLKEATAARDAAKIAGEKRIAAAEAEASQAKANQELDVKSLEAKVSVLEYAAKVATMQANRATKLRDSGVRVAEEDIEKAELQRRQAEAELAAARDTVQKTKTSYEQTIKAADAKIAAAKADLASELAKAPIESGQKKLKLAEDTAGQTTIRAPIDGEILKIVGRTGQPTGTEPILQMADLSQMTAIAEVYESDVMLLSQWVGQKPVTATITNPALGEQKLKGTVKSRDDITRMIARNTVFALGPREDVDRRVVEVTVHLAPSDAKAAASLVGLQVTVEFSP